MASPTAQYTILFEIQYSRVLGVSVSLQVKYTLTANGWVNFLKTPASKIKKLPGLTTQTAGKPPKQPRGWNTPAGCFSALRNGTALAAFFGNGSKPAEVTVRSRVFAPHKRGLQHIVVQGFIIEHGANQWIENFWLPQNAKYSQSGLLGTRSGFMWTIRNNTIRKAQTIALGMSSSIGPILVGLT